MPQLEDINHEEKPVSIAFYTDPLCCWSWAFEPQWRRLRYEFAGKLQWRYYMGGLISSWNNFSDPLYSVSRPLQMGPMWMEASQVSGQPMYDRIWGEDPPASSYPACVAVKCAALQSAAAEEAYLRRAREAVMLQGKNIAKEAVLLEIAQEVADKGLLDFEDFKGTFYNGEGQQAFREDLQKVRYGNISRFPTLTLSSAESKAVMIVGYRPYEVLLEALKQVAPALEPVQKATSADAYTAYWNSVTEKEAEVATNS